MCFIGIQEYDFLLSLTVLLDRPLNIFFNNLIQRLYAVNTGRKRLKARGATYFYRRIRLSTASAIFSGGYLIKPSLEIIFRYVVFKKTACRNS